MHLVGKPNSFVFFTVQPRAYPLAFNIVIFELSKVCIFTFYNVFPFSMHFIIFILSIICYAFSSLSSFSFFFSINEISFIFTSVYSNHYTETMKLKIINIYNYMAFYECPFKQSSISIYHSTCAWWFVVEPVSFIIRVIFIIILPVSVSLIVFPISTVNIICIL